MNYVLFTLNFWFCQALFSEAYQVLKRIEFCSFKGGFSEWDMGQESRPQPLRSERLSHGPSAEES
jgi:hypothetical protein